MATLKCKDCLKEYPATSEFFRKTDGGIKALGLSPRCKPCDRAYHSRLKAERAQHGGKREGAGRKQRENIKPALCLKCGKVKVDRSERWICPECTKSNSKRYGVMAEGFY